MVRQPFYPFRSERAKIEYGSCSLEKARGWPLESETMLLDTPSGTTFVRSCGRTPGSAAWRTGRFADKGKRKQQCLIIHPVF
jgi:hypothetical protein